MKFFKIKYTKINFQKKTKAVELKFKKNFSLVENNSVYIFINFFLKKQYKIKKKHTLSIILKKLNFFVYQNSSFITNNYPELN